MTDKYHSDTQEKIETLIYSPGLPTTGDKEAGTHTIVPTARPAIASAQYSHSFALAKPDDARLVVQRIAARLNVNIAGLGTATHVYCSVRVDVDDADHELFNEDWTSVGNKLDAIDTHDTSKAVIFNLLKDGAAHTFYFLFWADVASQATIDLVQLWEGVGSCSTGGIVICITLTHKGFAWLGCRAGMQGTGTPYLSWHWADPIIAATFVAEWSGHADYTPNITPLCLIPEKAYLRVLGTVATDLNCALQVAIALRSQQ